MVSSNDGDGQVDMKVRVTRESCCCHARWGCHVNIVIVTWWVRMRRGQGQGQCIDIDIEGKEGQQVNLLTLRKRECEKVSVRTRVSMVSQCCHLVILWWEYKLLHEVVVSGQILSFYFGN